MFEPRKINVILITQSSSEHSITVAINESDVEKAQKALNYAFEDDLKLHKIDPVKWKIFWQSCFGWRNMKSRSGVSAKLLAV